MVSAKATKDQTTTTDEGKEGGLLTRRGNIFRAALQMVGRPCPSSLKERRKTPNQYRLTRGGGGVGVVVRHMNNPISELIKSKKCEGDSWGQNRERRKGRKRNYI